MSVGGLCLGICAAGVVYGAVVWRSFEGAMVGLACGVGVLSVLPIIVFFIYAVTFWGGLLLSAIAEQIHRGLGHLH